MIKAPQWTDATSYSQGQRGKIEPTAWRLMVGRVGVYITKSHRYDPENWVVTCQEIGADANKICPRDTDHQEAKNTALKYVSLRLIEKSDNLRAAADAMLAAREGGAA